MANGTIPQGSGRGCGSGEMINSVIIDDELQETLTSKMEDMVQNIPLMPSNNILGNIKERKFNKIYNSTNTFNNYFSTTHDLPFGFPKVFKLDAIDLTKKNTNSKQSLFRQHVSTLKYVQDDPKKVQKDESLHRNKEHETNFTTMDQLAAEIHQENLNKLSKMSEAEILKEKEILENSLKPEILHLLKNKKKYQKRSIEKSVQDDNKSFANEPIMRKEIFSDKKLELSINDDNDDKPLIIRDTSMEEINSQVKKVKFCANDLKMNHEDDICDISNTDNSKMICENDTISIPKSPKEILDTSKQKGWLHMDKPEPEKLKWMEDLTEKKENEPATNDGYNARFDFNGLLLPYNDENLTVDKGLHHHGEEPERPGYSLQELLQLSRSSIPQQRCTGLNVLANIMEKIHEGRYDNILHPPPLVALNQKNILLLLRLSLDDASVAVVTAALQALRAFLVNETDEKCLDRLFGFDGYAEPILMPQLESKDTSSLRDDELAQLDAVTTLLERTDFLVRISYFLKAMLLPHIGVISALEILIYLARHSATTALNILSTPYLLNAIIKNYTPLSLLDILAMEDAVNDVYRNRVVEATKAIKLCRVLVTYGGQNVAQRLANDFKIIDIILKHVNSNGSIDLHLHIEILRLWCILLHYKIGLENIAGTLVSQLSQLLEYNDIEDLSTNELACERAAALISVASYDTNLKSYIFELQKKWDTQFSKISNITWGVMKLIATVLSAFNGPLPFNVTVLTNKHIFSVLRSSSNLLCICNPARDRKPSCVVSLDVYMENGEPQPIMTRKSCIPFFGSVFKTFYSLCRETEMRMIFEDPNFREYITKLEKRSWNLERSWYSRTELCLLITMVKAASRLGNINNQIAQIIWKIAIKLVSTLPADMTDHVKELLKIALSNEKMNLEIITNELIKLELTSSASQMDRVKIDFLSDAASLYEKYVVPSNDWSQAAMPKDWLFLPLVHIYNKFRNDAKFQPVDKNSIMTVLSLALILPDLTRKLSPTLQFSRLILVYLCDTICLDKDVSVLLAKILSNLLSQYPIELDFETELPGLNSFTDLFTVLCEQFYSSSYGDNDFAAALLVPIAQKHDPHYRKLLWSEHAAALRYLRLSPEKLLLPLKDYLYPEEEDTSLIDSYIMALVRGMIKQAWCPVPFTIALHHSAMYLKRTSKLAKRMRTQIEKLQDRHIADKLLRYEPPL